MQKGCRRAKAYLGNEEYSSENFASTARAIMWDFKKQIKEMKELIEIVVKLKSFDLNQRRWEIIFEILSQPSFKDMQFTFSDLVEAQVQQYFEEIQKVIDSAGLESGSHEELSKIDSFWKNLSLSFAPHKIDPSMYIVDNLNDIKEQISEQQIIL